VSLAVLLPSFLVIFALATRGPRAALVYAGLPILLLLPSYYTHKLPGVPVASFHNYAWALLFAGFMLGRERRLIRFHVLDLVVIAYSILSVWSEFENKAWPEAQNLLAVRLMTALAPYYLGKAAARSNGLLCGVLIVAALVGAFIGIVAPFEARFGRNPFDFWRDIWPHHVPWDGALYRFGLRRTAGPFAHPICQGFFFSMILPLTWWLRDAKLLGASWKVNLVLFGQFTGLIFAGSRGPWIGMVLSMAIPLVFWRRDRALLVLAGGTLCLLGAITLSDSISEYMTIERGQAKTQEQETVAYRWEMLDHYIDLVRQRPGIGYGKDRIPIVKGMKSIDNQYLYCALLHGLPAACAFLACMLLPAGRLFYRALQGRLHDPLTRLGLALSGVLLGAIFTQTTVFAGTQTEQFLFLMTGTAASLASRIRVHTQGNGGSPDAC
jgi:O-antigen ligase/polysaccharide polymerase Wzy-like membrane protein